MSRRREPRRSRPDPRPSAHQARKLAQLAAQIGRSIGTTLVGECSDEVLQNLSVESVEPAAGNRMVVTLAIHPPGDRLSREEVLARVEAWRGLLIERVMQDVSRRSVPQLSFWVVPESPDPPEPPAAPEPPAPDEG